jgi:1,4-dihydroxy-2-naphthoate octaprenyltransferase
MSMLTKRLAPWLGVSRGPFLLLPFTLVAAGAACAAYEGAFGWWPTALAVVALVLLHAAVNALNEASDMVSGIDLRTVPTPFSGGSKTLPSGLLSVRATRVFAYACVGIAGLIGAWFALRLDPLFLALLVAGAISVLFYSPLFARSGVGEVFAGLGLGLLPVWGAAWVQGPMPGAAALWAGIPAFLMTFNLLLLNEFPDEEADRTGGRKNLVLMLGRKGAALVYAAAGILTPLSIVAAVGLKALPPLALVATLPSLFLAQPLAWAFGDTRKPVPIPAMGANVVWNLATNVVLALALVLAIALR